MSRYVERMDNTARLLDAGRRLDALPRQDGAGSSEWTSIVIASGCSERFPGRPETATSTTVREHLVRDETNPSSIVSCILAARHNAKAVRPSLTSEVWEAINQTQSELKQHLHNEFDRKNLNAFLDWVQGRASLIVGAILGTMLRDDRYGFVQIGKWFERADATARLLDVKYHVLLPKVADVGGGFDYLQWLQILRAANSATAFRHVYGRSPDAEGVVDLLVLNAHSPRSLRTALDQLDVEMSALTKGNAGLQQALLGQIKAQSRAITQLSLEDIFTRGLHEWLTGFIFETNSLAGMTADAFGFGAPPVAEAS
ncbi:alpha-E domain-containing protein [Yoonia sp. I 8.24]|uniref:alpha-E domain-containing protein n=1 Tax=Yoonia sp. I 8.24 TaxID=1537229 RepID=UPI001EDFE369|nr:alpha-E domain-containing protein [Yoonia sp. I 8.24]MCG3267695.1 alpha-E domain-containing protein [Yoonia sp. I 8.24]